MPLALKRFLLKTCIFVWQLLRVCIALILIAGLGFYIFLVVDFPWRSGTGQSLSAQPISDRLSGETIAVPRSYLVERKDQTFSDVLAGYSGEVRGLSLARYAKVLFLRGRKRG